MSATLKLVPIGNSKGIRIPSELIRRYQLCDEVRITEMPNGIFIESLSDRKLSLNESFEAMAKDVKDQAEVRSWAESGLSEGLEGDEFKGWKR
jgi:antitoxin MazE